MRILLLGGTGTLSSDIMKLSLEKGYDVSILNRGNNNERVDNRVSIHKANLYNIETVIQTLEGKSYEVIIDFFSRTAENIERLYSVLSNKCIQYIFISSACVYCRDSEDKTFITEQTRKPNILWEYNIQKYEAEQILITANRGSGRYYTIVRPYITYNDIRIPLGIAPVHKYHRTIIERIVSGKPMFIWNGGNNYCTLTHTIDFAEAVVGLFLNEKAQNEDFHITSDYNYRWRDVLLALYKILNQTPNIVDLPVEKIVNCLPEYKNELLGDRCLNALFDNSKIKAAVPSLIFKISLEEGLKRVVDQYRAELNFYYDFKYDARIDRMLSSCGVKKLCFIPYTKCTSNAKVQYFIFRYLPVKLANKVWFFLK